MSFRKAFADFEHELRPTHDTIEHIPENGRTVAVIRHPLDRLVTICSWFFGSTDPLHEWLDSDDWKRRPTLDIKKRSPMRATVAISSPQTTWIRDETHLILFNDYQNGLDEWCDLAGYPRRQLEQRNKSNRQPGWENYLLPRHVERFSDYYAEDLAICGHLSRKLRADQPNNVESSG